MSNTETAAEETEEYATLPKAGYWCRVKDREINGQSVHLALITGVHGGGAMVNLKVFPDMGGVYDLGSVWHEDLAPAEHKGATWHWSDSG